MRLQWDQVGTRTYETGIDRGVLYLREGSAYSKGVAWSGLTSVNESPSGAEDNPFYADNIKYFNIRSAEDLNLTIECYTTPDEWEECDGSAELIPGVNVKQQERKTFGLSYRTKVGNDVEGVDHGYKLHLVYGCSASPSERAYNTINESPEPTTMSYEVSTTPVNVPGYKPTALVVVDSTAVDAMALAKLEDILYGNETTEPRLPMPDELMTIFQQD